MSQTKEALPPFEWLVNVVSGFIIIIVHILIIYKSRTSPAKFTTTSLKIWSTLCIISGLICGIFITIEPFPFTCKVSVQLASAALGLQGTVMGFYQLSRLNYCFSQDKVHSDKGYSNLLFICMYIIGGFLLITTIIVPIIDSDYNLSCGITPHYEQYPKHMNPARSPGIGAMVIFVYWIWDLITLSLYVYMVISLRKSVSSKVPTLKLEAVPTDTADDTEISPISPEQVVRDRIMDVLIRVVILTIFYEIWFILTLFVSILYSQSENKILWIRILYWSICSMVSISLSYAMLMMNNDDEYLNFLRVLEFTGLSHICCVCKSFIRDRLNNVQNMASKDRKSACNEKEKDGMENGEQEPESPEDKSLKVTHSLMIDLSVATATQCYESYAE